METIKCNNCSTTLPEYGYFCPSCASQSRCKECKSLLETAAKACVYCGTVIGSTKSNEALNTIEFKEDKEGRSFKASFTDTVGNNISESFNTILTSRIKNLTSPSKDNNKLDSFNETIDIDSNEVPEIESKNNSPKLSNFPIIKEVVKKDLPKTEVDWVLIYGFYSSAFGENPFSEKEVKNQYEISGRSTSVRLGNITNNINSLLHKEYIKMHNDNSYIIKEDGLQYARQVLEGNSTPKSISKTQRKQKKNIESTIKESSSLKKQRATKSKETINVDKNLNLREKGKKSFKEFYEEKKPKSAIDFNVVAIYYLIKILELTKVTASHVYTCYKEVSVKPPVAFYQSLWDTASKNSHIDTTDTENLKLPSRGENFVEFDLPKKK